MAAVVAVVLIGAAYAVGRSSAPDHTVTSAHGTPAEPGAADIGFAQDMATHHDQAVLMAQLALPRATPTVRAIAQSILISQSQEVGLLRGWLRLWKAPGDDPHPMSWMNGAGGTSDMSAMTPGKSMGPDALMPGMASPPQLDRLYRLTGRKFDVMFLQLMIRHHEGGLLMTQAALAEHTLATTKAAARGISSEQIEELGTMRALLAADGGTTLPVPS
jgi:uncharacterized protein (DUF305 family)